MSGPDNETPNPKPAAAPKKAPAPKKTAPTEPDASGSSSSASASQATAAVSNAVGVVRERLVAGEQLALTGAGLIAAVWIIFDLLLDVGGSLFPTVGSLTLLLAILLVLAIWVHRWGHYDFGNGYRLVVGVLGLSLAFFAVTDLLLTFRTDIDASAGQWLGNLLAWGGGLAAGYGGWLVFRIREEQ
jgi:hypothetical protein